MASRRRRRSARDVRRNRRGLDHPSISDVAVEARVHERSPVALGGVEHRRLDAVAVQVGGHPEEDTEPLRVKSRFSRALPAR